jgi:hypothetical protein
MEDLLYASYCLTNNIITSSLCDHSRDKWILLIEESLAVNNSVIKELMLDLKWTKNLQESRREIDGASNGPSSEAVVFGSLFFFTRLERFCSGNL